MHTRRLSLILSVTLLSTSACVTTEETSKEAFPPVRLKPSHFSELTGWKQDQLSEVAPAFSKSCGRIEKSDPNKKFGPLPEAGTMEKWQKLCRTFRITPASDLHQFFEKNFTVWQITADGEPKGLFTGYYESSLKGSRTKTSVYKYPLHKRPADLVMVDLGLFREELKGQRIAGRVKEGALKPYEAREDIIKSGWQHADEILVWVDSPIDAFFVQIQGSGVVQMDDGSTLRIGYDGQNGHPYYAIGKELVKRGALEKGKVSMQAIRDWLLAHPEQADEIMNTNKSYVFFKTIEGEGPIGGEGIALTAGRSLAIDRSRIPYGLPIWLETEKSGTSEGPIQRLMISQDTGGAIRGAVRGDVFWGFGAEAELHAGHMQSQGRYWALLPK